MFKAVRQLSQPYRRMSTICRQDLNKRMNKIEYNHVNYKIDITTLRRQLEVIREDTNKNKVNIEVLKQENENIRNELAYAERLNSGSLSWLPRV